MEHKWQAQKYRATWAYEKGTNGETRSAIRASPNSLLFLILP
jgi:hypothetical protein